MKTFRQHIAESRVPRFSSTKEARAWAEKIGAKKMNRGVQDSLTRRAAIYLTPGLAIRISNTKDRAYQKWAHFASENSSSHFPDILSHQDISDGITVTVLKRYAPLDMRSDIGKVLAQFTAKMNRDPNVQLEWLSKNAPELRKAMRGIAQWAKKNKLKQDLGNINNYMQDGDRVIIVDPVA